eukprot:CAMPEP_0176399920 /NCGR_PEP_ID=MMETSP0126-20121128/47145_1 /TAXON_ID=141414 ORGANISM="Strombidinopsis acuminatum, Strain SPMC142" /NCGR_SAMPLE_ID=MMETSP0126 /ASSEMBLY_ACC=CAM_ASM_000229 /LENGTH=144 /DNA_ID=CAMNT_0017775789 /DNA_START=107 /DNA_END=541 /DNA_ORIENTATION=-
MIREKKFIFVVVHPAREHASADHNREMFVENLDFSSLSWQKNKKKLVKLFGGLNPYTTRESDGSKLDFFGVVTFELDIADIGGMECTNSLIEHFSRFVFEANTLLKKSFSTVKSFFKYYNLPTKSLSHYQPSISANGNQIEVRT